MEKQIIATSLREVLIDKSVWEDAHYLWYEQKEKEIDKKGLDKTPIVEWKKLFEENPEKEKKEYFKFVDRTMKNLYPGFSEEERTRIARRDYFNSVVDFIRKNPRCVNRKIVKYFNSLKQKFNLALITTNTESALERILESAKIDKTLFDFIETSREEEKDDKIIVFNRFVKKYGIPVLYIGRGNDALKYCEKKGIDFFSEDFKQEDSLKKLKKKIGSL